MEKVRSFHLIFALFFTLSACSSTPEQTSTLQPAYKVKPDSGLSGNSLIDGAIGAMWAVSILATRPVGRTAPRDLISGTCQMNVSGEPGDEKPCRQVEVILIDKNHEETQRTWTDSSGLFYLNGVRKGGYTLRFVSVNLGLMNEVDQVAPGQDLSILLTYDKPIRRKHKR